MAHATPDLAFAAAWDALGGDPGASAAIEITGTDPVLPSSFAVGAFAGASVGVAAVAGAEVGRLRGCSSPAVRIDLTRAAAAFRSERHFRIGDQTPPDLWDQLSGYHRAGDGRWLQLHTNFAHHRAAAIAALRLPEDAERADIERSLVDREADAAAEAVVAAGGCAALLRSPAEWAVHPQAAAVRSEPLVAIERIGEASAPLPAGGERPLSGIRVLDLTRVLAGPVCGRFLAALGADVLHVGAANLPTLPFLDLDTGFGKRSCHIDLGDPSGVARLRELASSADIVVDAFRPGALAGLGLGPDDLIAVRPALIHVSIDAWGWSGPWAARRGFDSLVQTGTGIVAEEWAASGGASPRPLPCQALDHGTGYLAAAGACVALARRIERGGGYRVRLSLAATASWLSDLGRVPGGIDAPEMDGAPHTVTVASPIGPLTHVNAPAAFSPNPLRWDAPPPRPGADAAAWLG
jgi:CoA-transferase family III